MPRRSYYRNYWKADNTKQRLNSLARVLQKTDRILTGDRQLRVLVEELEDPYAQIPAVTKGKDLVLNRPFCDISTKTGVVGVIGMNWHELSHYLFTANNKEIGWAANKAATRGVWWSFNILEDQRIETLFSTKYEPAKLYFAQMVLDQILKDPKNWDQQWPLLHGRRYLPLEIRKSIRQRYHNQQIVKRVAEIIDEFRVMDLSVRYSTEQDRAFELAQEFHTLINAGMNSQFKKDQQEQAEGCADQQDDPTQEKREPDQHESKQNAQQAKKDTEKQDEKEEETGEDASNFWEDVEGDSDSDEDTEDTEGSEGDDEGEEGSGSGEDSEDSDDEDDSADGGDGSLSDDSDDADDAEEERSGDSEGGDSDRDGDSDEGDGADSAGAGQARPNGDDSEVEESDEDGEKGVGGGGLTSVELKEFIKDALDAIMESEVVSDEVQRVKDAVNDPRNFDVDESERNIQKREVPDEAKRQSRLVENEFKKLWTELEPGWHYGMDEGRLNVGRAMNSEDFDDVFDQWDEGKEQNAGIEVTIAVDVSGSMAHYGRWFSKEVRETSPLDDAMAAVWTIKRAVETLDGHVTVISFGEEAKTLISRHDKAKPNEMVYPSDMEGDTKPWDAIQICRYVLNVSDKPNKLFVIVTDGGWDSWDSKKIAEAKIALDNMPGTKMYMAIGSSNPNKDWMEYFHHNSVINSAADIAPLVRAAINTMLRNAKTH